MPVHAGHDGTNALGLVRHTPAAHAQVRALGQHLDANLRQLGRIARRHFLDTTRQHGHDRAHEHVDDHGERGDDQGAQQRNHHRHAHVQEPVDEGRAHAASLGAVLRNERVERGVARQEEHGAQGSSGKHEEAELALVVVTGFAATLPLKKGRPLSDALYVALCCGNTVKRDFWMRSNPLAKNHHNIRHFSSFSRFSPNVVTVWM